MAPPIDILPGNIWKLFVQCFQDGTTNPDSRPDAETWVIALREAEHNLITCAENEQHRYGKHLQECPWCKRAAMLGGRDPFPGRQSVRKKAHLLPGSEVQAPLPSVAQSVPLSMLGSLAIAPPVPVRVIPNRQPAATATPYSAPMSSTSVAAIPTAAPVQQPPAQPPMRVHVPTKTTDTGYRSATGFRAAVGVLVVAAIIGAVAYALRIERGNGAEPAPIPAIIAKDPTSASPSPPLTEAPAETLKQFNAAVIKGDEAAVRPLLSQYPGLANQRKKENGDTPLHFAAFYNKGTVAQLIIDAGSEVDAVDRDGFTPLRIAAQQGSTDVGTLLIQKGASINAADKKGATALHFAAQEGKTGMAKLLLDNGADASLKDNDGLTPFAVAKRKGNKNIIDLMRAAGVTQ
jgi:hypothetical protein